MKDNKILIDALEIIEKCTNDEDFTSLRQYISNTAKQALEAYAQEADDKELIIDTAERVLDKWMKIAAKSNMDTRKSIIRAIEEYGAQFQKEQPLDVSEQGEWRLEGHSYQIADTGDYDGHYEITNGKISLLTKDDDEEALKPIINALNNSDCKFYQDDFLEFENSMLKNEIHDLKQSPQSVSNEDIELLAEKEILYTVSKQDKYYKLHELLVDNAREAFCLGYKANPSHTQILSDDVFTKSLKAASELSTEQIANAYNHVKDMKFEGLTIEEYFSKYFSDDTVVYVPVKDIESIVKVLKESGLGLTDTENLIESFLKYPKATPLHNDGWKNIIDKADRFVFLNREFSYTTTDNEIILNRKSPPINKTI